jgi:hypothetical protein
MVSPDSVYSGHSSSQLLDARFSGCRCYLDYLLIRRTLKHAANSSTEQDGEKRRARHQAADWISPYQCRTHHVIEIGIGEAALQLQPRNNPLNEDAALLKRQAVGCYPDSPQLRICEGHHAGMVLPW